MHKQKLPLGTIIAISIVAIFWAYMGFNMYNAGLLPAFTYPRHAQHSGNQAKYDDIIVHLYTPDGILVKNFPLKARTADPDYEWVAITTNNNGTAYFWDIPWKGKLEIQPGEEYDRCTIEWGPVIPNPIKNVNLTLVAKPGEAGQPALTVIRPDDCKLP